MFCILACRECRFLGLLLLSVASDHDFVVVYPSFFYLHLSLLYFQTLKAVILQIQGSMDASSWPLYWVLTCPGWKIIFGTPMIFPKLPHGMIIFLFCFFKWILDFPLQELVRTWCLSELLAGKCSNLKYFCLSSRMRDFLSVDPKKQLFSGPAWKHC